MPFPKAATMDGREEGWDDREDEGRRYPEQRLTGERYAGYAWHDPRQTVRTEPQRPLTGEELEAQQEEVMWRWQVGRDIQELGLRLRAAQEENKHLKEEIGELKGEGPRFKTPHEEMHSNAPKVTGNGKGKSGQKQDPKPTTSTTAPPTTSSTTRSPEDQRMEFMALMLQSMQAMQQRLIDDEKHRGRDS